MPTFIVLLRGVNVGKAKRVPMADFKALLLGLGCTSATTLLNSGNAVVTTEARTTSQALATKIAAAMVERFGFEVPVVVKTAAEFEAIVRANSLEVPEEHHARLLVAFGQTPAAISALAPLADITVPPEQFLLQDGAAYLYCAGGILDSPVGEALLGKPGRTVTTRNWSTVLKLVATLKGLARPLTDP